MSDDALLVHIKRDPCRDSWRLRLAAGVEGAACQRGIRVGKDRVQKLMQLHGIRAEGKRRFKVTTDSNHDLPVAPNLLEPRLLRARARQGLGERHHLHRHRRGLAVPGRGDRPVQPPGGGLVAAAAHARELVIDALRMAWFKRHPASRPA